MHPTILSLAQMNKDLSITCTKVEVRAPYCYLKYTTKYYSTAIRPLIKRIFLKVCPLRLWELFGLAREYP